MAELDDLRDLVRSTLARPIPVGDQSGAMGTSCSLAWNQRVEQERSILRQYSDALRASGLVVGPRIPTTKPRRKTLEAGGQLTILQAIEEAERND